MSIYLDIEDYYIFCPKCNSSDLYLEFTEIDGEDIYYCCNCEFEFGETIATMEEKDEI